MVKLDIEKLDRKKIYEVYCHIRYTVQSNHCESISIDEVMKRINDKHKEDLFTMFSYDNELIDFILKYVKENKK